MLLVETLHLFPLMTLSIVDSLGQDLAVARLRSGGVVGSRGFRKLLGHPSPSPPGLCLRCPPGLHLDLRPTSPLLWKWGSTIYLPRKPTSTLRAVRGSPAVHKMGSSFPAIMILLAISFLIVAKKYVALKDYQLSLLFGVNGKRFPPREDRRGIFLSAIHFLLLSLIWAIPPRFLRKGDGAHSFPVKYTCSILNGWPSITPSLSSTAMLYSGSRF